MDAHEPDTADRDTDAPLTSADDGWADDGWVEDILGPRFESRSLDLGTDPDGEGPITATLVRFRSAPAEPRAVMLYVHGLSDYFFQVHVAKYLATRGVALYALDLRKCGRSRREGLTPHYVSDLEMYDTELDDSMHILTRDHPGTPVIVGAHSTGGLVTALWLSRRRDQGRLAPIRGIAFNSPWFELDLTPTMRRLADPAVAAIALRAPKYAIPLATSDLYGKSIHASADGEFDFDLTLKPFGGVGVRAGWLRAIRRGQKRLHRGLHLPVPALQLRSSRSSVGVTKTGAPDVDADLILDVASMAKWLPSVSESYTDVPLEGARHDVFLSDEPVRQIALTRLGEWIDRISD